MRRNLCAAVMVVSVAQTGGAAAQETRSAEGLDLAGCRAAVAADPNSGRELAARWGALGGGAAARLCAGEALLALGANIAAAEALTEAGADGGSLTVEQRVTALTLAGDQWLAVGAPEVAERTFRVAVGLDPTARDATLGLARTSAALGAYAAAIETLDAWLASTPGDSLALAFRAAAHRAQGDVDAAARDAQAAVDADGTNGIAWFELGAAERARGDLAAARRAFLQAVIVDRDGPAGFLAERAIQEMAAGE